MLTVIVLKYIATSIRTILPESSQGRQHFVELKHRGRRITYERSEMIGDQQLLDWMKAGDESAFAALYGQHQGAIYRFALHMTGSSSAAEDVTQETFLTLLKKGSRY